MSHPTSARNSLPYSHGLGGWRHAVDQDRTNWSARQYADALNGAGTVAELLELAQEVNERWGAAGELEDSASYLDAAAI